MRGVVSARSETGMMATRFHDALERPAGCAAGGERRTTLAHDADGNQTRVTTRTGRWRVEYNGC